MTESVQSFDEFLAKYLPKSAPELGRHAGGELEQQELAARRMASATVTTLVSGLKKSWSPADPPIRRDK